ncbi:hypothetical protein A3D80_03395 [Candidatus Roizmanbacteria bacterium RIFCSPHIGHO2_02_FULL_40_13b]|uniref:Transcriptional regulator n=1 Tax=Candidatus Roizmanbacteria bacterium RIFCSPHIGHO2_01_FULL_39_24 TaxID=1802032 RepID=A0A1F7GLR9_9BACT|nr:MAG: hypothetical protein A2799_01140 [Candidatus Roizmanbacteria bacterium RIFCSPHIGHO2_01_FULL_39_24]OGK27011.1 MAG: hypothetical protein A3D80_03395 [Candidatus Roizmanbacteria bacterium RIFCSPHIGHO2_02_FULL_40_13b]OGK48834.1 MAG: hypothetical protein A3A56_01330 [Candidatus Roizmanbacteria bacterium RIFCSPLOWO2_01_FULL_40_32]OGK57283.1 MAG: hypothetical protein A3H83_00065 [Candidatus Roizmanbacteria bacterium RIFCSPLOWO2_02_FULL_39_8]
MSYKPKDSKERVLHRLKIARGHLNKVISMIESDEYCIDVLTQSQAVQKAIIETDNLILENHLKSCVSDSIKNGNSEEAIAEVMNIFKKSN